MNFPEIDPVLLQIGPFAIRWYALAYVAGILLAWRYTISLVRKPRLWGALEPTLTPAQIDDLVLWVTLGVIAGGRLGSILFYSTDTLWKDPLEVLQVWKGGMSFHGGLIGVSLALIFFSRAQRVDLLRVADVVAPGVPIGLFLVRLANFVNGELWGRVTDLPWGVVFCNSHIRKQLGECPAGLLPRHPSQVYEAVLEGIVLFLILRWATHHRSLLERRGVIAGLFLFFYGLFRVAVEMVRNPDAGMENVFPLGLTMGMALSIPMILIGAWLIWRGLREPLAPPAASLPPE